nr:unnamed protein product [Digitaria exilis]
MDWIVSASANEMKASPLPNASPILKRAREEERKSKSVFSFLPSFGLCLPTAGNNIKKGVHVAAAPAH